MATKFKMKQTTKTKNRRMGGLDFVSVMPNVPQVPIGNAYRLEDVDFKEGLVRLQDKALSELQGEGIFLYVDTENFEKYFHGVEKLK